MNNYIDNIKLALLIIESPYINSYTTPDNFKEHAKFVNDIIDINKSTEHVIGDDEFYNKIGKNHFYYHRVLGVPKEFSVIDNDNIQRVVSKRDGDIKHIHNFIHNHLHNFGVVNSSNDHSVGAKSMWQNFISNNTKYKISLHDSSGNKIKELTPTENTEHIWSNKLNGYNSFIKVSK